MDQFANLWEQFEDLNNYLKTKEKNIKSLQRKIDTIETTTKILRRKVKNKNLSNALRERLQREIERNEKQLIIAHNKLQQEIDDATTKAKVLSKVYSRAADIARAIGKENILKYSSWI